MRNLWRRQSSPKTLKEAQDFAYEALKARTKTVSSEHDAGVKALVLVEENCGRLQQELDRVQKENKQIHETLIKIAQKEQDLVLAGQRDECTIRELVLMCE